MKKSLVLSAALAFFLMATTGCIENGGFGIRGEGPVVERTIELDPVKGITLQGSARIILTQGHTQEVKIQGQENIIENLTREVDGGIWEIGNKRSVWKSEPLKIFITLETLRVIKISGSGTIESANRFTDQKDLEIRISGSGKIDLDIEAREINARISGSGDLIMKGTADYLDFSISGSGDIHAFDLKARKADAGITGAGGMELSAEDNLDAHISGSGSINYHGNPRLNTSISGSGSVRSK